MRIKNKRLWSENVSSESGKNFSPKDLDTFLNLGFPMITHINKTALNCITAFGSKFYILNP